MTARLLLAAVTVLALTACETGPTTQPATTPAQAPKPPSQLDMYRKCVKPNPRNQNVQRDCQVNVWGTPFDEDDDRWSCLDMGNLACGPAERKA